VPGLRSSDLRRQPPTVPRGGLHFPTRRTGITASLSSDEGRTWRGKLVLDPRDNVSYPDAAQASDGTIYAVHDRERYGAAEILLSIFTKKDIG
jgi:hypothetical protein